MWTVLCLIESSPSSFFRGFLLWFCRQVSVSVITFSLWKFWPKHETVTSAYLLYASTALCFLECMACLRALGASTTLL